MPEYGCNRYQPNVRNVVICSCLEQQHIRQHSLPARTKYENRCILVFTLQLLLGITFVLCTNTINQYNARKRVQPVPSKWRNVVICSCWSNWHIGQHSLPEITKHENRCLLVFYFATRWQHMCFMNKHHQSNIMPEVGCNRYHPNVRNVVICSCLEKLTQWAAPHLPARNQVWEQMTFSFYFALDGITCVSWINTINQYNVRRWVQQVWAKCT